MMRYGKWQGGMRGQKLYASFYMEGHEGLMDYILMFICTIYNKSGRVVLADTNSSR